MSRAGSILCCGEQSMHTEFRVRTVCELTLNEKYYLQSSIASFCTHKNILLATSGNFHQAAEASCMTDSLRWCFQLDCCDASKSDTLTCGMCMAFHQSLNSQYTPSIQKLILAIDHSITNLYSPEHRCVNV